MLSVDPKEITLPKLQSLFQGVIAPRPIALASTVDASGLVNLSPFSFFNMFSMRPPILIFSPARRGRNNTTKHTLENVLEVPEVVINIVNFSMVGQVSLASVEFPKGVNEFVKSGLTPVASERVRPPRVAQSPASFECIVKQVMPMGDQGGAGNLVICEVVLAHFSEEILDDQGKVDPQKLDAVARMGGDYYCRAHGDGIFTVPKPVDKLAVGIDQLPESIRHSKILTGNELARLGNIEKLPDPETVAQCGESKELKEAVAEGAESVHRLVQRLLKENKPGDAWAMILAGIR